MERLLYPAKWLAAAQLESGNAQYWEHLALYNEWNLEQRNLPKTIHYLQRATEINPLSARLWMELAAVNEDQRDWFDAKRAYEIAEQNFPASPDVAWRYGSFLLRRGNFSEGLAALQRALDHDPSLEATALSECWDARPDAAIIAEQLLPQKSGYYVRAISYFLSHKQTDAALVIWTRLLTLNQSVPMTDAIDLIDHLMTENRLREARQVWHAALQRSGWPHDANDDGSLLFNGGFEHHLLNGGFDWRELPVSGASYDFDSSVLHSGRRSLRIVFGGTANVNFQHIYQYVPVTSHQHYRFLAYLRTEETTTDRGIQFEIFDPRHPQEMHFLTPDVLGTNAWTPVQVDFESGPRTRLLEILLRRIPSIKFANKVRGTVWVDDVSLVPIKQ